MNWELKDKVRVKLNNLNMTATSDSLNQQISKHELSEMVKNRMAVSQAKYKVAPLKKIPKTITSKSGFGRKFTTKTSSFPKYRDLSATEKNAIFVKQRNSTTLKKNVKNFDKTVESRFLNAKNNFKNAKSLEVSQTMEAMKVFLSDNEEENTQALLTVAEHEERFRAINQDGVWVDNDNALITTNMTNLMTDAVDKFMDFDFGLIQFTNDSEFVKESPKLIQIVKMTESMLTLQNQVSEYFQGLEKDLYDKFREKLEYGMRVVDYYHSQSELINDEYYKNHANSELTIVDNKQAGLLNEGDNTSEQKTFLAKLWKREVYKKSMDVQKEPELKAYLKGLGANESMVDLITNSSRSFVSEEMHTAYLDIVSRVNVIEESNHTKGYWTAPLTLVKLLGYYGREKRTDNHGIKNSDAVAGTQGRIHASMYSGNYVCQKGEAGFTPEIQASKYLGDEKKTELLEFALTLEENQFVKNNTKAAKIVANLKGYSQIQMLQNKDTFEMEMYYIDSFIKGVDAFTKELEASGKQITQVENAFIKELGRIKNELLENGKGSLKDTIQNLELKHQSMYRNCEEHAIALYDNHGIAKNMKESNVKDIPLFTHEPSIIDINQGTVGDCWLMGSLQAMVVSNPNYIKEMFQDLGNGEVIVRLYVATNFSGERVSDEDDAYRYEPRFVKLKKHYETGSNGAVGCIWPQLLEKAITVLNTNYDHGGGVVQGEEIRNVSSLLTSGSPENAMSMVTGMKAENKQFRDFDDRQKVEEHVAQMQEYFRKYKACGLVLDGHVVTALDMQMKNGEAFVLIRDTFNIYQKQYTRKANGKIKTQSDGLGATMVDHKYMNNLSQNPEENLAKAVRGLSWWRIKDVLSNSGDLEYTGKEVNYILLNSGLPCE